jgi:hypothetical protein
MKLLILGSIFCLTFAITLPGQAPIKVVPQIIPLPANIGVWSVVQGVPAHEFLAPREHRLPSSLALTLPVNQNRVCSVPLLEVHANASDTGIGVTPRDNSVPIPQARVPAPPCKKE